MSLRLPPVGVPRSIGARPHPSCPPGSSTFPALFLLLTTVTLSAMMTTSSVKRAPCLRLHQASAVLLLLLPSSHGGSRRGGVVLLLDGVRHSWPICTAQYAYTQTAGPPRREVRVSIKEPSKKSRV